MCDILDIPGYLSLNHDFLLSVLKKFGNFHTVEKKDIIK